MKVIITGANGFLGSRLAKMFADQKHLVFCIVKDSNEDISSINHPNIKIIYCDLLNIEKLKNEQILDDADLFYNFAWAGVSTTYKNDFEIQYKNIMYSFNAIKTAKLLNCKKFIGIGSISEFAYASKAITGNEATSPSDYYSIAKIASRNFCEFFALNNSMNFNWALITSVYGPGRNDNNLITYTIKSLLNNETPSYTSLEQNWDYIYIDDVINALYLIGLNGKKYKVYTIGTGTNKKLKDYIYEIKNIINPSAKINIGALPYKTNKIDNSMVDISSLINDTGYNQKITFEEGIKKTINYFTELSKIKK